jgi:ribokinase
MPHPGEVMHAREAFTRAAGGGGVAAAVLADLGAEVEFFTALGRDADGEAAAGQLRERGVQTHVAWREQPTRRAVTLLEDGGERTIVTIGDRLAPDGDDDLEWDRLGDVRGVYFTAGDRRALEHARRAPIVVASPRAREVLDGQGPRIDALVFSERDHDERQWAARVGSRARLLVATAGARGGSWRGESEGSWSAVAPPGPPRDSYGCGDSFAAAFTFALASEASVTEAADLGARWGAKALTVPGAP